MMKTTNYILLSIGCLLQPLNAGAQNYGTAVRQTP